MTYKVIANIPDSQTIAVVLDDRQVYLLNDTHEATSLLHMGKAPRPSNDYKYVILDKDTKDMIRQEPFTRVAPFASTESTLNEHFSISWNRADEYQLVNVFDPLPVIRRIESKIHVQGQIPTLHITGNPSDIDSLHHHQLEDIDVEDLQMIYISVNEVKTFDHVKLSISGRSTRLMPKLGYAIQLSKKQELYGHRRFKLRASAADPTFMTENMGYSMANAMGLPASQYSYVRLYINQQSIGLFGFVEHLKNPWVRNEFGNGDKDYQQGTLWVGQNSFNKTEVSQGESSTTTNRLSNKTQQQLHADFSYFGRDNVGLYQTFYPVKEKPSKGEPDYSRLIDFTEFLSKQPDTIVTHPSVVDAWEHHIDVESFLRTMALDLLTMDTDGFVANNNNFLLYDDVERKQLVLSEQDFDLSCGIVLPQYNASRVWGGNYSEFPGMETQPLSSKILQVPAFREKFDELMRHATQQLFTSGAVRKRIDTLYAMLQEDVAWDKSLPPVGEFKWKLPANMSSMMSDAMMKGVPFEQAVYGPASMPIQTPIAEWARLRGENLEAFIQQTTGQPYALAQQPIKQN
ncbi:coth protein-domain-containing protein [Mycotypha africana]|uniref:coth protein-domain-containing protein n=1 Tax=Mycotypha africana TaxID=64632 RepID=UPI0023009772|nr:coth protein-domain-containing protein [Mycotypha africana]KAI8991208.1 coth protein-domain-containing protein [Mycotypha africana]